MARQRDPRSALVRRLRLAHAGELAAARAYAGHWRSVRDAGQRAAIRRILQEELAHRACVGEMLRGLGAPPGRLRDGLMWCVGTAIAASCFVGGWYVPMYGAGRIERRNIWEYEDAARLARTAGRPDLAEALLAMAEVEWDHERYFHEQVRGHWLHGCTRSWAAPPPREEIRRAFLGGEAPATARVPAVPAARSRKAPSKDILGSILVAGGAQGKRMGNGLLILAIVLLLVLGGPLLFLNVVAGALKVFLLVVVALMVVGLLFGWNSRRHAVS